MTKRFLVSAAAAALIAGTGFAYAQGAGVTHGATGGAAAQQSAPSTSTSGSAGRNDASEPPSADMQMKSTESYEKTPHEGQRAQGATHNEKSKSMRSESNESGKSEKNMRAEDRNGKTMDHNRSAEERNEKTMDRNRSAEEHNGMKSESSKSATDTDRSSTTTTGQAGAGAKLSTEQRTKITTVIKSQHVQPTTNVNFSISVGTRVPRSVQFHPLPTEIVEIYPTWRGYEFILVRDQIVVVDPHTLEIVAVLEA
mgnify:CR=1 FL=1